MAAAAGGFDNGLAGTGKALLRLGFYLLVSAPITAVAVVAFMSLLAGLLGLWGLWVVRSAIRAQPSRVWRYVAPGLVGVPLGVSLLKAIDADTLRVLHRTLILLLTK